LSVPQDFAESVDPGPPPPMHGIKPLPLPRRSRSSLTGSKWLKRICRELQSELNSDDWAQLTEDVIRSRQTPPLASTWFSSGAEAFIYPEVLYLCGSFGSWENKNFGLDKQYWPTPSWNFFHNHARLYFTFACFNPL
jgi:hypothetical protein